MNALSSEIVCDRIILIKASVKYIDNFFSAIEQSYSELLPWLKWVKGITKEACKRSAQNYELRFNSQQEFQYYIYDLAQNNFIGCISLQDLDWHHHSASLGYWLTSTQVGKGYITEALSNLEKVAKNHGFITTYITCDALNTKSSNVAKHNGYELIKVVKNDMYNNTIRDTLVFRKNLV